MTTRPLLQLAPEPSGVPQADAPLEWLVTNGLGGYAAGSDPRKDGMAVGW